MFTQRDFSAASVAFYSLFIFVGVVFVDDYIFYKTVRVDTVMHVFVQSDNIILKVIRGLVLVETSFWNPALGVISIFFIEQKLHFFKLLCKQ
jgi:hypothetical protein